MNIKINPIPRSPNLDMGFFEVDNLVLIIIYSYFVDIVLPIVDDSLVHEIVEKHSGTNGGS